MRHRTREQHDHPKWRPEERQERSRQHRQPRQRQRELPERNSWRKEERKMNYPAGRMQQKDKRQPQTVSKINRKQICPFLVRVFYSINKQNVFQSNGTLPQNQLFLHLWMDCSFREIVEILRAHLPSIRTKQRFQFWRVFGEQGKTVWSKQQLGSVLMHRRSERLQERYLENSKYKIGDFLDVSINYK